MKLSKKTIAIFLGPMVALYTLVIFYPSVRTMLMSFFSVSTITDKVSDWTFYGLQNFVDLFKNDMFMRSMGNIVKIWFYSGIVTLSLALLFAIILSHGIKGKSFFRSVIYLPNVIAAIAVGYMWLLYVFNNKFGLLANVFNALGMESAAAFEWTSPNHIFLSMNIAYCFGLIGYYMLIYLAGIEKIPADFYEAATIEGANTAQQFFFITLPLLKGVLATSIVLWTTKTMAFFALSLVFSDVSTVTPMLFTYQTLFGTEATPAGMNVGLAAAAAVIMSVVAIGAFMISNVLIKDEAYEY